MGDTFDNPAFVLRKKGHFCYETRPAPVFPSENYVIVVIHATGLCGSDIHYWQHGEIGQFKVRQPLILGHESAGVVQQCGSTVKSLKVGDRVALEPGIPCRFCSFCRTGRYNLCADVKFAATPPHDGTLAKYYAVPEDFCYKLPDHVSLEEGALIEPLSVAVHCTRLGGIGFGSAVLVLGAGPIGLLCCAVARAFGATVVVAVDIVDERLKFARSYAATAVYKSERLAPEDNAARIKAQNGMPEGFEVVIEATGAEACIGIGLHALRRGGTFVQAGLGPSRIGFPISEVCSKEANFRGSFRYGPGDYATAILLVERQKVSVKELITHIFAFEEAEKAFENAARQQGIKSIILGPETAST